jgi:hypothetical protein
VPPLEFMNPTIVFSKVNLRNEPLIGKRVILEFDDHAFEGELFSPEEVSLTTKT